MTPREKEKRIIRTRARSADTAYRAVSAGDGICRSVTKAEDELLRRMRQGDEQAFLDLYRNFQGPIYRFALNMTGSPSVAEDITQEVFLALIREECGYNAARGPLAGYLFGIARKLVMRYLERGRMFAEPEFASGDWNSTQTTLDSDLVSELLRAERIEVLRRAVISLPRRYREVVVLCDLEEMNYTDAAALLGCPVGTVRSRLHRARALLLEKLEPKRKPRAAPAGWKPVGSLV